MSSIQNYKTEFGQRKPDTGQLNCLFFFYQIIILHFFYNSIHFDLHTATILIEAFKIRNIDLSKMYRTQQKYSRAYRVSALLTRRDP
jgi:hypothetical protein